MTVFALGNISSAPMLTLSMTELKGGSAAGTALATVSAPQDWSISLVSALGGVVSLFKNELRATSLLGLTLPSGVIKIRAQSPDGRRAIEETFDVKFV